MQSEQKNKLTIKNVMAHLIEELDLTLSTIGTEWHGLANHVDEITDETVAPLLFPIVTGSPMAQLERDGELITVPVPGHKIILADQSHRMDLLPTQRTFVPLHVPRESYQAIPNAKVWECMKDAIADTGAKVVTCGTLDNLKKFYISVELENSDLRHPNGDKFQAYLNFLTSHDGTMAFELNDSMIRVVCHNTFQASRAFYGNSVGIRHSANADFYIKDLSDTFNKVLQGRQKTMESMAALADIPCRQYEAAYATAAFLAGIGNPATKKSPDEISTQVYNSSEDVNRRSMVGMGNSGKTRYDVFNGFTERFTHAAGGKKATNAQRWSAANYGQAADYKTAFLDFCQDEKYEEYVSIGEKLFKDKMSVMMAG